MFSLVYCVRVGCISLWFLFWFECVRSRFVALLFCRIGFELVASCCFMRAWVVGLELVVWLFVGWLVVWLFVCWLVFWLFVGWLVGCFVVPVGLFWFLLLQVGFDLVASCCFMCAWVAGLVWSCLFWVSLVFWLFSLGLGLVLVCVCCMPDRGR